ncbi:hypothetical protein CBL_00072 [Carabus blaptoides fortunei]
MTECVDVSARNCSELRQRISKDYRISVKAVREFNARFGEQPVNFKTVLSTLNKQNIDTEKLPDINGILIEENRGLGAYGRVVGRGCPVRRFVDTLRRAGGVFTVQTVIKVIQLRTEAKPRHIHKAHVKHRHAIRAETPQLLLTQRATFTTTNAQQQQHGYKANNIETPTPPTETSAVIKNAK